VSGREEYFVRAFGVCSLGRPDGGIPNLPLEVGGPRFGRWPVVDTRKDCFKFGRARKFDGATRGSGIGEVVADLVGGATRFGRR
jgi:hypothetical protein